MSEFPPIIQRLIALFSEFPGVGQRTATRYVLSLAQKSPAYLNSLAESLQALPASIKYCEHCFRISETTPCSICKNPKRRKDILCIVSSYQHIDAIEKLKQYPGIYFVLGGTLNPLEGVTPQQLHIPLLLQRVQKEHFKEIILALNPDINGESTSMYLTTTFKKITPKTNVSRLARGLPMGADLDYADQITLTHALKARNKL